MMQLLILNLFLLSLCARTPNFTAQELNDMGYAIAIYPAIYIAGMITGSIEEVKKIERNRKTKGLRSLIHSFGEMNNFLSLQ
jgi:2-methylisocitrate lyase-like PEP mutase family enzyme